MKRLIWTGLIVLAAPAGAGEVRVKFENLKPLIETRNERIHSVKLEAEAARRREGHLTRSFLPRIEAHYSAEKFKTGTQESKNQPDYGAEASVNLFNGGRDLMREKGLESRTQRKEAETAAAAADEVARARELYWSIVYLKNALNLLKEAEQTNDSSLKAALRRIRSGVATESDRLEFEMRALDLKREVSGAELEMRSTSRDLLVMLGYEADDVLITDSELAHGAEWESEIKHTHADHEFLVKPAELAAAEAEFAAREASRTWVPTLDAYVGWNQYNQREEDPSEAREREESVVGVRAKWSLFNGFNSHRESQALRDEAASARALASYRRKQNEAHIEKEFDELKFLHDRVHESDSNIKSAQRYYTMTQSEYSRGVKNSPDVLGASEKLLAMKIKRLEMIRDFQVARSHVLSKIGK